MVENKIEEIKEKAITVAKINKADLECTDKGIPLCIETNIVEVFRSIEGINKFIRYNEWRNEREYYDIDSGEYVPYTDAHTDEILITLQKTAKWMNRLNKQTLNNALSVVAKDNSYDPALEYLDSLPEWDGVERLSTFCSLVFGTKQDEYHVIAGTNFWLQILRRMTHPGYTADTVLVVDSKEGMGKSSVWNIICGVSNDDKEYKYPLGYVPIVESEYDGVNFILKLQGNLIAEFTEGLSLRKVRENESLKAFITQKEDKCVLKMKNYNTTFKRRFVLTMATNETEYLTAEENRRFIPVEAKGVVMWEGKMRCDIKYLEKDRDQFFAEALHRVKNDEKYSTLPADVLAEVHRSKLAGSQYFDLIQDWLENPTMIMPNGDVKEFDISEGFTMTDIWLHALDGNKSSSNAKIPRIISKDLQKITGEKAKMVKSGGIVKRLFFYEK